jgi:hypothetical protein
VGKTGAGPLGVPVSRLGKDIFRLKLKDLYENPSYKERAVMEHEL